MSAASSALVAGAMDTALAHGRTDRPVRAEAVLEALERHGRKLGANLLLTYLALIAVDGISGAYVRRVAAVTGFADSTTARQLAELERLGYARRLGRSSYTVSGTR